MWSEQNSNLPILEGVDCEMDCPGAVSNLFYCCLQQHQFEFYIVSMLQSLLLLWLFFPLSLWLEVTSNFYLASDKNYELTLKKTAEYFSCPWAALVPKTIYKDVSVLYIRESITCSQIVFGLFACQVFKSDFSVSAFFFSSYTEELKEMSQYFLKIALIFILCLKSTRFSFFFFFFRGYCRH